MTVPEISVHELKNYLPAAPDTVQLIDVREEWEVEIAFIDGFSVFPLGQYESWQETIFQTLDPDKETLVICHHGVRSLQMCQWLQSRGFTNVKNIAGGIDAYSVSVDEGIPRY